MFGFLNKAHRPMRSRRSPTPDTGSPRATVTLVDLRLPGGPARRADPRTLLALDLVTLAGRSRGPATLLSTDLAAASEERRRGLRYAAHLEGSCVPAAALATMPWPVQAVDISARGIGLLAPRRFEPGTLLSVSLSGANAHDVSLPLAQVRRCIAHGHSWLLGCVW